MKKTLQLLALIFLVCLPFSVVLAQEEEEEEDFSQYDSFEIDENVKRYCTPKVVGLSPAKLITLGYDFAGPHSMTGGAIGSLVNEQSENVSNYHGMRIGLNLPVLSNNKWLINVGGLFYEARYNFENSNLTHPLHQSLADGGIRSAQVNTTIFKPLNKKNFLLGFYAAEYSGNYNFSNFQNASFIKHTWVGLFGFKPHDRLQYGFGATQSYRAGEVNYFPVVMYNFTSENRKWGIEALVPARAHYRYKLGQRQLLLAGFELEGTSFHLANRGGYFPLNPGFATDLEPGLTPYDANNIELRRSEIRLHAKYEYGITSFIWLSAQVGYALNYRFDVDNGEFFRGFFKEIPYVMENQVGGAPYIQLSINLVSP
jgi:hypothetical protein